MTSDVRRGMNESWFRGVNERLEERVVEGGSTRTIVIVCECAQEECTARIEIPIVEYEAVRSESTTFLVLDGHEDLSCDRVISARQGYNVVEKFGDAGLVAEIENPREGE